MEKITVKELVNFRRKTDVRKKSFALKLKNRKPVEKKIEDNNEGGNYWITSVSCIYNVFKHNNDDYYDLKIDELNSKLNNSNEQRTKDMYQRNQDVIISIKDFQLLELRPSGIEKFERVQKGQKIILIKDFPIYVNPSLLFAYDKKGKKELGALWIIPQLGGFKKFELGMFCEVLYKFLVKNYSDDYQISEENCIVLDACNPQKVTYKEIIEGEVFFLVDETLEDIKKI